MAEALLDVDTATARILDGAVRLGVENVGLMEADGRTLAADIVALRTQPSFAGSSMDGYAMRHADVAKPDATLRVVGESAAGARFGGAVPPGSCVRIFTGAPLPPETDCVIAQEDASRDGDNVRFVVAAERGKFVRPAGFDFSEGDLLVGVGARLDPSLLALAAAANHATLPVARRPVVAIIATGSELVRPGEPVGPDQTVASNTAGIAALIARAGGTPLDCGIAPDDHESLAAAFERAGNADIIVTLGGASVGDHDLVREALIARGVDVDFWKLAMQPGKPVMFGRAPSGDKVVRYLGLPGNPVSGLVGCVVLLAPLVRSLLGGEAGLERRGGVISHDLPASGPRRQFMRARAEPAADGVVVTPFNRQDSSLLTLYAKANALLIREENRPALPAGSPVEWLEL